MNLKGKTVLVTGGAVRLGRAICEALAAEKCRVVVHYRDSAAQARGLAHELAKRGLSAFTVRGDLSTEKGCRAVIRDARKAAGRLDILVNNAAVFHCGSLAEAGEGGILAELKVNLVAPLLLIREFAGQTRHGKVVNLLDQRIAHNETGCVPYLMTKTALAALTRSAALELAPGITVNGVAPGAVLAPVDRRRLRSKRKAGAIPLGRRPAPEDVARAVVFLLESDSITGQVVFVDGGQHLL